MTNTMPYDDTIASDFMWDACRGGGGPWATCQCGIDHYSSDPESDEYNADDIPDESDTVKIHYGQSVGYVMVDDVAFVYDCVGCKKKLRRYENFIWNNRAEIRDYLKNRIKKEKEWADHEQLMNIMAGINDI